MIVTEGGWRCSTGHRNKADFSGKKRHRDRSRHVEVKIERERKRKAKRRRKMARAYDRRRIRDVEAKYGYHAYHKCTSKRRYSTLEKALSAAATSEAVFDHKYYVYHCELCDGYHLTTHCYGDGGDETIRDTGAVKGGRTEDKGH